MEMQEPEILCTYGASNKGGSEVDIVLKSPEGLIMQLYIQLGYKALNNEAEYDAFIAGHESAIELVIKKIQMKFDSKLMVNQISLNFNQKIPECLYICKK